MSLENKNPSDIAEAELEFIQSGFAGTSSADIGEDAPLLDFEFESPRKMGAHLQANGFRIPVLQLEKLHSSPSLVDRGEFRLPITKHDIYEDTEYGELCAILRRLDSAYGPTTGESLDAGPVYFRLDYRAIWTGLTNAVME